MKNFWKPSRIPITNNMNIEKQFTALKKRYPDTILFFRIGDRFEFFGNDRQIFWKVTGLTLSSFSHEALDTYLRKLIRQGYRVAVCEQLEKDDPKQLHPAPAIEEEQMALFPQASTKDHATGILHSKRSKIK